MIYTNKSWENDVLPLVLHGLYDEARIDVFLGVQHLWPAWIYIAGQQIVFLSRITKLFTIKDILGNKRPFLSELKDQLLYKQDIQNYPILDSKTFNWS